MSSKTLFHKFFLFPYSIVSGDEDIAIVDTSDLTSAGEFTVTTVGEIGDTTIITVTDADAAEVVVPVEVVAVIVDE